MAQQTLWAKIKEWIGGVGFAIYLWSQTLTAEEYFDLLESDAEQRRGAGAGDTKAAESVYLDRNGNEYIFGGDIEL